MIKTFRNMKLGANLTVLCPGIILDTEANFKFLSPPLEIQIKDFSSCNVEIKIQLLSFRETHKK